MSDNTCPECGKECASEKGMKIHRTKAHGEWREYDCPSCADSLETYKGLKCHHYHKHGESISGETVNCSYCGNELSRKRNVAESQEHFFCNSKDCQAKWNEKLEKEEHGSWNGGKEDLVCDWCDNDFSRRPSESSYYDKSFCKKECYFAWIREDGHTGEDNPAWNGGHSNYYGSNWTQNRHETLERDDFSCQVCDMSREEHYEKYGFDLDVHHKIPIDDFDEPENANYLINLVTTCRSCHGQLDTISRREAKKGLEVF